MKTSLGIWALGSMVDPLHARRYKPEFASEPTADKVRRAVEGLGDLMDGYEFHYPQELSAENLDAVRDALDGHDIYCVASGMHLDPIFGRGGLSLARRPASATRAIARGRSRASTSPASSARTSSSGPGSRATTTRSRRRTRELGALHRRDRAGRARGRRSAASRSCSSTRTPSRR